MHAYIHNRYEFYHDSVSNTCVDHNFIMHENNPKCVELGWRCIPLAVESYGAWGPEASKAFSQVATRIAIRGNTPKAKIVAELYGRLSLSLVRANARSILCRFYPQTPQQENELIT